MTSEALITRNSDWTLAEYTDEAFRIKADALAKSALVGHVSTPQQNQTCVEAQQAIAEILSMAEKSRVACKAPALEFGRIVDAQYKSFVADLKEEQVRLAAEAGSFQQLEEAKRIQAERARRLEEERIEREKQNELFRVAQEAAERQRVLDEAAAVARRVEEERQRKADEAHMAARRAEQEATNKKQREAAEQRRKELEAQQEKERIEAERRRIELEEASAKATAKSHAEFDAIAARAAEQQKDLPPVSFAPARAEGQRVTNDWDITVSDPFLLAKCHPNCVKIEPRLSEIKDLLKLGVKVNGVIAKPIIKAGTTNARPRAAIEV